MALSSLGVWLTIFLCSEVLRLCHTSNIVQKGVERPLRIGAFNIQNLGVYKMSNEEIMNTVEKVILRYDILLVQEIVTQDRGLVTQLLHSVNRLANTGSYGMKLSERLGRRTAKEQYAYFFRTDKVSALHDEVFPDAEDAFMRPPYIVHFSTPTVDRLQSLIMIGIHTQPSSAANETSSLAQVYKHAAGKFRTKNAVILGDMNAGCTTVRKSDWENVDLWTDPTFDWLIGHDVDTTTGLNSCPYDRIVIAGDDIKSAVIRKSAGIFNFQEEYGLTEEQTTSVSDHWPVEVLLKGKLSEEARNNLRSSICIEVHDKREVTDPLAMHRARKKFDFKTTATKDDNGNYIEVTAEKSSDDLEELIDDFKNFAARFPRILHKETVEAVHYKVTHGALEDATSHNEISEVLYNIEIRCNASALLCNVTTCRDTSIN